MLKKIAGYFFAGIGLIGFGFFRNYKGTEISYSTLWFSLSIALGLVGLAMIYFANSNKLTKQEKYNIERLDRLKWNGEKIILTSDNCEIRENNYYKEVISESSSRIQQVDALYDPNRNYLKNYIEESAIIYYHNIGDKKYRLTSQSFPFNKNMLANYIEAKMIVLYVNRDNQKDYAFEIVGS